MKPTPMCHIPVCAHFKVINGKAVMIDAEYENIPAELIAQFLLQKTGGEIPQGGGQNA